MRQRGSPSDLQRLRAAGHLIESLKQFWVIRRRCVGSLSSEVEELVLVKIDSLVFWQTDLRDLQWHDAEDKLETLTHRYYRCVRLAYPPYRTPPTCVENIQLGRDTSDCQPEQTFRLAGIQSSHRFVGRVGHEDVETTDCCSYGRGCWSGLQSR